VFDFLATELVGLFVQSDGQCTEAARGAIRLGFHDAGAWSKTSGFGGADGSLLLSPDEIDRPENDGLQSIVAIAQGLLAKYKGYGLGAADLVQFMATVGTVACPLGPRILSFVGRPDMPSRPPIFSRVLSPTLPLSSTCSTIRTSLQLILLPSSVLIPHLFKTTWIPLWLVRHKILRPALGMWRSTLRPQMPTHHRTFNHLLPLSVN
jgi:hypothetical protein